MSRCLLTNASVLTDGAFVTGRALLLEGATIEAIVPDGASVAAERIVLPPGSLLAPGLIDIQVNGGGGVLFNDTPTAEAARAIAAAHRRLGTTSVLPTLITDTPAAMHRAADAVRETAGPLSPILGLHCEGPFLSPERPGIHPAHLLRRPEPADLALLEAFARHPHTRLLLTLAPEMVEDTDLRRLADAGIVLSAGHSAATYERTLAAMAAGLTGFTHLFNAMPGLAARAPGLAAAALLQAESWCGIIADGIHVHPAMLRLVLAARPARRILLVSDAMSPTGTDMTAFTLQGRRILRHDGKLTAEDGTLAGADICLADAVRYLVRALGVAPALALAMASTNQADFLGLDRLGRIAPGCRADLVLLTPDLDLLGTWLAGDWQGGDGQSNGQPTFPEMHR